MKIHFDETNPQGIPNDVPSTWETVCKKTSGGNKQAFGLCIAYCEAQDQDYDNRLRSKSRNVFRETYMEIIGAPMPCECPCIGGLKGFSDALKTIDRDGCTKDLPQDDLFGIRLSDNKFLGVFHSYMYFGCSIHDPKAGLGRELYIEQNEADQCVWLLTSIAESSNLVSCFSRRSPLHVISNVTTKVTL